MSYWLPTCILLLVCPVSTRAGDDPVFDVPALLATPLNAKTLKTTQRENIITEEVSFHSEMDGEKNVEIFAYFSYPRGTKKLPAYIWNPGGLGQASPAYTEAVLAVATRRSASISLNLVTGPPAATPSILA